MLIDKPRIHIFYESHARSIEQQGIEDKNGLFWKFRMCMKNVGQTNHLLIVSFLDQQTSWCQLNIILNLTAIKIVFAKKFRTISAQKPKWN